MADNDAKNTDPSRRRFITGTAKLAMAGGLLAGYGTCAAYAGKFLYPTDANSEWMFVARLVEIKAGDALEFTAPNGVSAVIARQADSGAVSDFVALSNVCPHLGCKVYWELHKERFFCPCHNGTFDKGGTATGGPPKKAGQMLLRFPLKVQEGLLFVHMPADQLA